MVGPTRQTPERESPPRKPGRPPKEIVVPDDTVSHEDEEDSPDGSDRGRLPNRSERDSATVGRDRPAPVRPDKLTGNIASVVYLDDCIRLNHEKAEASKRETDARLDAMDETLRQILSFVKAAAPDAQRDEDGPAPDNPRRDDALRGTNRSLFTASQMDAARQLQAEHAGRVRFSSEPLPDSPEPNLSFRTDRTQGSVRHFPQQENRVFSNQSRETAAARSTATSSSLGRFKIRRSEIGTFDPSYPDPGDLGIVTANRETIFTDVFAFQERIDTFLEDEETKEEATAQLMAAFQTLLSGPAILWWTSELTAGARRMYRNGGLEAMVSALKDRFAPDSAVATGKFNRTKFGLSESYDNPDAITHFIMKKLRYARAMGILTSDNSNWQSVMVQIWSSLDKEVKVLIRPPSRKETMDAYMMQVDEAKSVIHAFARSHSGRQYTPVPGAGGYNKYGPRRDDRARDDRARDDRTRETRYRDDRYRDGKPRDNQYRDGKPRDDRYRAGKPRDDRRREDQGRDDRRPKFDTKRFDGKGSKVYNIGSDSEHDGDRSDAHSSAADSSGQDDAAYVIQEFDETFCHRGCGKKFRNPDAKRAHEKNRTCIRAARREARTATASTAKRTCMKCGTLFPSRNKLFRHLSDGCSVSGNEAVLNVAEKPCALPAQFVFGAEHVVEEPPVLGESSAIDMGGYSHMKVTVRATPNSEDLTICQDTGTGRSLVDRHFLKKFEDVVIVNDDKGVTVKGYGGKSTPLKEWATWSYFAPGTRADGTPGIAKFYAGAWVVEELDANALLSNSFLHQRGAQADFDACIIQYPHIGGFSIPFEILKTASQPVIRKVSIREKINLLPGESTRVRVAYCGLPKGRSFMFSATHPAGVNALLDADTPRICLLTNSTEKTVKINKNTRLGTIHECADTAYILTDARKVASALAVAATLPGAGTPSPLSDAQKDIVLGTRFSEQNVPFSTPGEPGAIYFNSEFTVTPDIEALLKMEDTRAESLSLTAFPPCVTIASSDASLNASHDANYSASSTPSETPLSDVVYGLTRGGAPEEAGKVIETLVGDALQEGDTHGKEDTLGKKDLHGHPLDPPEKPDVSHVRSALGLKVPEKEPHVVTKDGVHVYNGDPKKARALQKLCENLAAVWEDKGPVDIPEDQQLKVPLVDGWQNMKFNYRSYPLGREEQAIIDKTHDKLHEQGRMEWVDGPTPFALPVFVAYRNLNNERKGRAVVDLRAVNRASVPDSYPLPLQHEIIESIRGKKFLTVIDASKFFLQFLVHPDYRDRFTIISHRGLERAKVALLGYRNSPAYVQRFMDRLLKPHRHFCRAFIDDVVIFSDSFEDHMKHLEAIFRLFIKKNIGLSAEKSFVGYPSVELLGFYVDALGMHTTEFRTQGFRDMKFPETLKQLETYLGATGFLRNLIPYYAQISEPLQKRKTAMLAQGRAVGRVVPGNPGKRQAYTRSARIDPSPQELASFEELQRIICEKLMTHHPNPDKQLFLQLDGSIQRGFGVMVYHLKDGCKWEPGRTIPSTDIEPVMFLSRCLTQAELKYGSSELEVACLVWACKRLRTMLHSNRHRIIVLTDHDSTKGIVNSTSLNTTSTDRANRRLSNASIYLSSYPLDVVHMPGRLNLVPDALSRLAGHGDEQTRQREDEPALDAIWDEDPGVDPPDVYPRADLVLGIAEARMSDALREEFMASYKTDSTYGRIIRDLQGAENEGVLNASKFGHPFVLEDGLLYNINYEGERRLTVPHALIPSFLREAHDDKHHFGAERMLKELSSLHFKGKTRLVNKYVQFCHACGMNRNDNQLPIGRLQPIQSTVQPMHTITLDFVTGLPTVPAKGTPWGLDGFDAFDAFLTVTCKSSKRKLLIPGNEKYTAQDWGQVLGRQLLLSDWGCPHAIISDRDPKFTSSFWTGMWKAFGTRLQMTASYHPQSDGQSERTNQTVELAIRYHAYEHPDQPWVDILPSLQWNLNNSHTKPIGMSPHEYLFGFKIASPLDRLSGAQAKIPKDVTTMRYMREHLRKDAQIAMDDANALAKIYYDKHHRWEEFEVGDKVWLSLGRAYRQKGKPNRKEMPRRQGSYTIVRKVSPLAYELDFPPQDGPGRRLHPVVSIQYLKRYKTDEDPFDRIPPPPGPVEYEGDSDDTGDGDAYEIERIVDHMDRKDGRRYLVRWKGSGPKDDQWKTARQLKNARRLLDEYLERLRRTNELQGKTTADGPRRGPGRPRKRSVAE